MTRIWKVISVLGIFCVVGAAEASQTLVAQLKLGKSESAPGITVYENGTAFLKVGSRSATQKLKKSVFEDIQALARELDGVKVKTFTHPITCRAARKPSVRMVTILSHGKEKLIRTNRHCALKSYVRPVRDADEATAADLSRRLDRIWSAWK